MHLVTDERLAAAAQAGDRKAVDQLVRRHQRLASGVASEFFAAGHERDDVLQEAMIGLLEAIDRYQPGHGATFVTFARLAIRRQCIDMVMVAGRMKHRLLSDSVREATAGDTDMTRLSIVEVLHSRDASTHDVVEAREAIAVLRLGLLTLTDLEWRCVIGVALGMSYAELQEPGYTHKTIDNALARGRRKLRAALDGDLEQAA